MRSKSATGARGSNPIDWQRARSRSLPRPTSVCSSDTVARGATIEDSPNVSSPQNEDEGTRDIEACPYRDRDREETAAVSALLGGGLPSRARGCRWARTFRFTERGGKQLTVSPPE